MPREQITTEIMNVVHLINEVYSKFGFKYFIELSTVVRTKHSFFTRRKEQGKKEELQSFKGKTFSMMKDKMYLSALAEKNAP